MSASFFASKQLQNIVGYHEEKIEIFLFKPPFNRKINTQLRSFKRKFKFVKFEGIGGIQSISYTKKCPAPQDAG